MWSLSKQHKYDLIDWSSLLMVKTLQLQNIAPATLNLAARAFAMADWLYYQYTAGAVIRGACRSGLRQHILSAKLVTQKNRAHSLEVD